MEWDLRWKLYGIFLAVIASMIPGLILVFIAGFSGGSYEVGTYILFSATILAVIALLEDFALRNVEFGERIGLYALLTGVTGGLAFVLNPVTLVGVALAFGLPAYIVNEFAKGLKAERRQNSDQQRSQRDRKTQDQKPAPQKRTHDTSSNVRTQRPEELRTKKGSDEKSNLVRRAFSALLIFITGFGGAVIAAMLSLVEFLPSAPVILIGGLCVAGAAWVLQRPRRFLASGAVYYLVAAIGFHLLRKDIPDAYSQDALIGLVAFGLLALSLEVFRAAIGMAVTEALEGVISTHHAGTIWRAISAVITLLVLAWNLLTAWEKVVRYSIVGGLGTITFILNLFGIELPIPIWWADGIDATIVLYVGTILVGFSILDTLFSAWEVAKLGATASATGAKKSASAATTGASKARAKARDVRDEDRK